MKHWIVDFGVRVWYSEKTIYYPENSLYIDRTIERYEPVATYTFVDAETRAKAKSEAIRFFLSQPEEWILPDLSFGDPAFIVSYEPETCDEDGDVYECPPVDKLLEASKRWWSTRTPPTLENADRT